MIVRVASLLLLVVGLATCASPLESPADGDIIPLHEVYSQPSFSGIDSQTALLIVDSTALQTAWASIFSNYGESLRPPLPAINFESSVVLLAAAGTVPTQLYSFRITEVRESGAALSVRVEGVWPTCGSLPVITSPVHVVSVPRLATEAHFTFVKLGKCD